MKGVWHHILRSDLTKQKAKKKAVPEDIYKRFNLDMLNEYDLNKGI